jgi:acetamidase/formamidase
VDARGHHGAMGIAPDLMECTRKAVAAMVEWIVAEHGLSREDAYMLCSLAGDLKILEVVDAGMWNVGLTLPVSVFVEEGESK